MEYSGKNFLTIKETVKVTGLSECYLRSGCRAGLVPHIMSGNRYLINVPMLTEILNRESKKKQRQEVSA